MKNTWDRSSPVLMQNYLAYFSRFDVCYNEVRFHIIFETSFVFWRNFWSNFYFPTVSGFIQSSYFSWHKKQGLQNFLRQSVP